MGQHGQKTILTIYETNDSFGVLEETEGLSTSDLMKLVGYLDMYKQIVLKRIIDALDIKDE